MAEASGANRRSPAPLDAPAAVFAVLVVVAGPLIAYLNRSQWFYGDEFAFLFKRDLGRPASFLEPHWGHLTALPAALYQGLYRIVGLEHYWPYQWLAIVAHLAVAVLLRVLMRRAAVHPWLATAAASAFLFLGSGRENFAWGFQVTLTGSIAFGLAALVVLTAELRPDRVPAVSIDVAPSPEPAPTPDSSRSPEPSGRSGSSVGGGLHRELVAAALLVGSVLCSNVGVVMVLVAGGAALAMGRGRVGAAAVAGPPAVLYLLWSALAPSSEFGVPTSGPGVAVSFGAQALAASVRGLMRFDPLALAVPLMLAAGAVVARRRWGPGDRARFAAPAALLSGAAASAVLLGYARAADTFVRPGTSRYVYMVVSLLVVPVAVAVNELVRDRGRWALALGCGFVLVGLPGNITSLGPSEEPGTGRSGSAAETAHLAALAAESDLADDVVVTGELTVGDLSRAHRQGRLPEPPDDPVAAGRAALLLAFELGEAPSHGCVEIEGVGPVTLAPGQSLAFEEAVEVTHVGDGRPDGGMKVAVSGGQRAALVVRWGPITVQAVSAAGPVDICG